MPSTSSAWRRHGLIALAIAAAALAIGAVFGSAGSGQAAAQAVPVNTGTPTISGTPQEGATLTGTDGTWSESPTSFAYTWSRCDGSGNTCAAISGATAKTYKVQAADVGHTLRLTVKATNSDGSAESTSVPTAVVSNSSAPGNTAVPTISGTVQIGSTLTTSDGTWTGTPTGFTYAWSRCDQGGNSCATINGATTKTYTVTQADVGTTLRASVTATNGAGSTEATSVPTALVPALVATGCPSGTGVIQVASLTLPARLAIGQQTVTPSVVTRSTTTIRVHVRITACNGRPVQGALVFVSPVPYNQFSGPETPTGADGSVTITMSQRRGFPATSHQRQLTVFVRARKQGDPVAGGVSTSRLVGFRVSLSG
jgi:hypothetical protein